MSERAPAPSPAPAESLPETSDYVEWAEGRGRSDGDTSAEAAAVDSAAENLEGTLDSATNPETDEGAAVNAFGSAIDQELSGAPRSQEASQRENPDSLALNDNEKAMKLRLESIKLTELRTSISEKAIPMVNRFDRGADKARNTRDMAIKKGTLLEYREKATERKVSRVEAALERATPGTARYRRLSKKFGKLNINLGNVRGTIGRLEAAPKKRASENERVEKLRVKEIQRRRDILRIEKKVAYEKVKRREKKEEAEREGDSELGQKLKNEIENWPRIGEFRKKLVDEAMKRYKAKEETATNETRSDYEHAA